MFFYEYTKFNLFLGLDVTALGESCDQQKQKGVKTANKNFPRSDRVPLPSVLHPLVPVHLAAKGSSFVLSSRLRAGLKGA